MSRSAIFAVEGATVFTLSIYQHYTRSILYEVVRATVTRKYHFLIVSMGVECFYWMFSVERRFKILMEVYVV